MSESYLEIQLDQQPIELYKVLKIADLVSGGGEAKVVISEGYVLLNGDVEYQKRKKIYHNDIIEFNGETIQIIINENITENEQEWALNTQRDDNSNNKNELKETPLKKPAKEISKQHSNKKAVPSNESTAKKGKRKPISF